MNHLFSSANAAIQSVASKVYSGNGIIDTAESLNTDLLGLVRNGAVTIILIGFLIACWRKGWAAAAMIGGLLIAGIGYFAVNGGFEVIGNLFKSQLSG